MATFPIPLCARLYGMTLGRIHSLGAAGIALTALIAVGLAVASAASFYFASKQKKNGATKTILSLLGAALAILSALSFAYLLFLLVSLLDPSIYNRLLGFFGCI